MAVASAGADPDREEARAPDLRSSTIGVIGGEFDAHTDQFDGDALRLIAVSLSPVLRKRFAGEDGPDRPGIRRGRARPTARGDCGIGRPSRGRIRAGTRRRPRTPGTRGRRRRSAGSPCRAGSPWPATPGSRVSSSPSRYERVSPVSTMSSTTITSPPGDGGGAVHGDADPPLLAEAGQAQEVDVDLGGTVAGVRSARKGTAPLSTPSSTGSRPS